MFDWGTCNLHNIWILCLPKKNWVLPKIKWNDILLKLLLTIPEHTTHCCNFSAVTLLFQRFLWHSFRSVCLVCLLESRRIEFVCSSDYVTQCLRGCITREQTDRQSYSLDLQAHHITCPLFAFDADHLPKHTAWEWDAACAWLCLLISGQFLGTRTLTHPL